MGWIVGFLLFVIFLTAQKQLNEVLYNNDNDS